jgi:hypothetical protein
MRRPRRRWGFTLVCTYSERNVIHRDRPPRRFWTRYGATRRATWARAFMLDIHPEPVTIAIEVGRYGPVVTRP